MPTIKKKFNLWAWVMGIGIILFAAHNQYQPLKEYLFLPTVGLVLVILSCALILSDKKYRHQITFGSKWVYIPLMVIVLAMGISGFLNGQTNGDKFAPLMFGTVLFCCYLVARILGKDIFKPFIYVVIIEAVSVVIYSCTHGFVPNGGLLSSTNYDIAAGVLIFGTIVSYSQRQWIWCGIATVGVIFTGAPEGYFALVVLFIIILVRRDWSKRLVYLLVPLTVVVILAIGINVTQYSLWNMNASEYPQQMPNSTEYYENPLMGRIRVIGESLQDVRFFGHGYTITEFTRQTVHNVPLVIVQQVGIIAALAWVFVVLYATIKTKWKYAWLSVLALSVFDHYLWTMVAPWIWILLGVSTNSSIENDYIFKRESESQVIENNVPYKLEPEAK